jgi:hypothetical protein
MPSRLGTCGRTNMQRTDRSVQGGCGKWCDPTSCTSRAVRNVALASAALAVPRLGHAGSGLGWCKYQYVSMTEWPAFVGRANTSVRLS